MTISVPEGTPVRVHGPGLPFNIVDRGSTGTGPGYDVRPERHLQRRHRRDAAGAPWRFGAPNPRGPSRAPLLRRGLGAGSEAAGRSTAPSGEPPDRSAARA